MKLKNLSLRDSIEESAFLSKKKIVIKLKSHVYLYFLFLDNPFKYPLVLARDVNSYRDLTRALRSYLRGAFRP